MRVDIFCQVIDNWGDAGVCWRLAKQLANEQDAIVRLWIDQPQVLSHWLNEGLSAIEIGHWHDQTDWALIEPADWVIEAFACQIPQPYIARMAQKLPKPKWFNLEYLSAEHWVNEHHLLPSPQAGGLLKIFYFPGFTEQTGGLLREQNLLANRDQFLREQPQYWSELTGFPQEPNALKISLFGYEHMPLEAWLPLLAQNQQTVQLAVTYGKASEAVKQSWMQLGFATSESTGEWSEGRLKVRFLPMLSQQQYDYLLWSADFNAVRGEDSLVRAIWAGKPFVWDIYKQEDDVHWDKLKAFCQVYTDLVDDSKAAAVWTNWQMLWNEKHVATESLQKAWLDLQNNWLIIDAAIMQATQNLAQQTDLVTQLMQIARSDE